MFPSIFIISVSLLFSFFMHYFLSFKFIIIVTSFISFLLFLFNKNKAIVFLMSAVLFFFWHEYQLYNHFKIHQELVQGRKFSGMIVNKKELDKKYLYLINLYSYKNQSKKQKSKALITVITKKNIPLGQFVFIPFIFFIQKYKAIDELKANSLNLTVHASGMAGSIIIEKSLSYQKVYALFNFLSLMKEYFYYSFKVCLTDESRFFFDTIFLGKSINNQKYRHLFFTWGISHYLARSGLHIQICITLMMSFFLFLGFSWFSSAILQLFLLFLFYLFTFSSISFFRAFIMFFLFLLCKLFKLPTTSLHTLSMTVIITFFMYPFCFLQLGTQLTFFTTFILSLISYVKCISNNNSTYAKK